MPIEKMYSNEFQKPWTQQFLFEVSLYRFHFVSAIGAIHKGCPHVVGVSQKQTAADREKGLATCVCPN